MNENGEEKVISARFPFRDFALRIAVKQSAKNDHQAPRWYADDLRTTFNGVNGK
jgi:hypothetical protein